MTSKKFSLGFGLSLVLGLSVLITTPIAGSYYRQSRAVLSPPIN